MNNTNNKACSCLSQTTALIGLLFVCSIILPARVNAIEDPPGCSLGNGGQGNTSQGGVGFDKVQAHVGDTVPVFPALGMSVNACRAINATGTVYIATGPLTNFLVNVTLDPGVLVSCPANGVCRSGPYNILITSALVGVGVTSPNGSVPGAPKAVRVVQNGTGTTLTGNPPEQLADLHTGTIGIVTPCIQVVRVCDLAPGQSCFTAGTPIRFRGYVTNCGDITLTNVTVIDDRTGQQQLFNPANGSALTGNVSLTPGASAVFSNSFPPTPQETSAGSVANTLIATARDTTLIGGPNAFVTNSALGSCAICDTNTTEDPPGCSLANGGMGNTSQGGVGFNLTQAHVGDTVPVHASFGMAVNACKAVNVTATIYIATGPLTNFLVNVTANPGHLNLCPQDATCQPGPYNLLITPALVGAGVTSPNGSIAGVPKAVRVVENATGTALTGNPPEQLADIHTGSIGIVTPCIQVFKTCDLAPGQSCFTAGTPVRFRGSVTNCGDITLTNVTVIDNRAGPLQLFNSTDGSALTGTVLLAPGASAVFSNSFLPTPQETSAGSATDVVTATARDTTVIGGSNAFVTNSTTGSCTICGGNPEDPPGCSLANGGMGNTSQGGVGFNLTQAHVGDTVPVHASFGMVNNACKAVNVTATIYIATGPLTNFLVNITVNPGDLNLCPQDATCQPGPYNLLITPALVGAGVTSPNGSVPGAPKAVRVMQNGTGTTLTGNPPEQLADFHTGTIGIVTPCIQVVRVCDLAPGQSCFTAGTPIRFRGYVTNCGDITLTNVTVIDDRTGQQQLFNPANGSALTGNVSLTPGASAVFSNSFPPTPQETSAGSVANTLIATARDTTLIGGPNAFVTNSALGSCAICDTNTTEDPPGCSLANGGLGPTSQGGVGFNLTQAHVGDTVPVHASFGMAVNACKAVNVTATIYIATGPLTNFLVNVTVNPGHLNLCPQDATCQPGPYNLLITPALVGAGVTSPNGSIAGVPKAVRVVENATGTALTGNPPDRLLDFHTDAIGIVTPCIQVFKTCDPAPGQSCFAAGTPVRFRGYVTNCGDITLTNVTVIDNRAGQLQLFNPTDGSALTGNVLLAPGASAVFSNSFLPTPQETSAGSATDVVTATARDTTVIGGSNAFVTNSTTGSCTICGGNPEDPPGCSIANGGMGNTSQGGVGFNLAQAHVGDTVPVHASFGMAVNACKAVNVTGTIYIATGPLTNFLVNVTVNPNYLNHCPQDATCQPGPYNLLITPALVGAGIASPNGSVPGVPKIVRVVENATGTVLTGNPPEQVADFHTGTIAIVTPCIQVVKICDPSPGQSCFTAGTPVRFRGYVTNCGDIILTNVTVIDDRTGQQQLFNPANGSALTGNVSLTPGASAVFSNSFLPTPQETSAGSATNALTATARDNTVIGGPNAFVTNSTTGFCTICRNPHLVAPTYTTNGLFQFTVLGQAGSNYVVQASTNLATSNWLSLRTNAVPFTFVESNTPLYRLRFYRALLLP